MRVSIYTPSGVLLKEIVPKERGWRVTREQDNKLHVRFITYTSTPHGTPTDRLHIHGDVILIIQEDQDNNHE